MVHAYACFEKVSLLSRIFFLINLFIKAYSGKSWTAFVSFFSIISAQLGAPANYS